MRGFVYLIDFKVANFTIPFSYLFLYGLLINGKAYFMNSVNRIGLE